jgi:hypothetical protein
MAIGRDAPPSTAIAQVVEGDLLVAAIGDVTAVGRAARLRVHALPDAAHAEAERAIDRPHRLGIALGEVVVHRDDVHRAPSERGGRSGQRRGERLALAGLHFRNHAVQHRPAADQLHVEVPLADAAGRRLTREREGLRSQLDAAEALVPQAQPQLRRPREQCRAVEQLEPRCGTACRIDDPVELAAAQPQSAGEVMRRPKQPLELARARDFALRIGGTKNGRGRRHQIVKRCRNSCRTER